MNKKGRTPGDYPQFAFRLTLEEKEELQTEIKIVTDLLNKNLKEGDYLYRKNDIIVEALRIGLKKLRSNPKI